jgi:heme A synthase
MSSAARSTLAGGAVAGPLFAMVELAQACSRAGFDLTSTRSAGSATATSAGSRSPTSSSAARCSLPPQPACVACWPADAATRGLRLIAVFGAGTVAAGAFVPDPAYGFPPGTPGRKSTAVSWHGALHCTIASLAFLALIVACFFFASRFRNLGQRGWATCSALIGALLVVGVGAISIGSPNATANVSFVTAALLGFLWVSALAAWLRAEAGAPALRRSPRSTSRKQASAPTAG